MAIQTLTTVNDFNSAINEPGVCVIDFNAQWCGPCQMIAPKVDELAVIYGKVRFYSVDVEAAPDVASLAEIGAMPTFQFYENGNVISTVIGANLAKLKTILSQLSQ
jgi:thioredoxin 1